jgi:hypothetical protein
VLCFITSWKNSHHSRQGITHALVDQEHIITKQKLLFHNFKVLLKSITLSHLYPGLVAPRKEQSCVKRNVHFCIPRNLKRFTKPCRLTSLKYEPDVTLIILQTQITAQEYLQNHYIYVAFAYCSIYKTWSPGNMLLSRMSPNMPVQNLISSCSYILYCSLCAQKRGKSQCKTTYHYNYSRSAQSHCFMNTDSQRNLKF